MSYSSICVKTIFSVTSKNNVHYACFSNENAVDCVLKVA
jgi:hypothetical protein